MRHVNLRPTLGDSIQQVQANVTRKASTRPHGVKVMSEGDDVVWTNESGEESSVRKVDAAMVELDATMAETRTDLATLNDTTLPELQAHLEQQIADIVVTGGGTTTTYSVNEPSADGAAEGDTWYRVVDGKAVGQWQWSSGAWVAVTLTDAVLAGVDVSKLTATGTVPTAVVNKLFADVFSANKIGANQINANSVASAVGNFLELKAEQVTSGSFVGEKFSGGLFEGATFRTSDPKPGAVTFSETAYVGGPGISIEPKSASEYATMPGIGGGTVAVSAGSETALHIDGGVLKNGASGSISTWPHGAQVHWGDYSADTKPGVWFTADPDGARMEYAPDRSKGTKSSLRVDESAVRVSVSVDNGSSALSAGAGGIFLTASKSSPSTGKTMSRFTLSMNDLTGIRFTEYGARADGTVVSKSTITLSDTGWITTGLVLGNGWQMPTTMIGNWEPLRYRVLNGVIYLNGWLSKPAGSKVDEVMCTLPDSARPARFFNIPGRGNFKPNGEVLCPEASTAVALSAQFPIG